jgi:hypothetical protein
MASFRAAVGELPDSVLTEARRRSVKKHACALRARLSSHELMYLVGALEVRANGKRAEEEWGA